MNNGLCDIVNIRYLIWVDIIVFNQNPSAVTENFTIITSEKHYSYILHGQLLISYEYCKTFNKLKKVTKIILNRINTFFHIRDSHGTFSMINFNKAHIIFSSHFENNLLFYAYVNVIMLCGHTLFNKLSLTYNLPMYLPTKHTFSSAMQFKNSTLFQIKKHLITILWK